MRCGDHARSKPGFLAALAALLLGSACSLAAWHQLRRGLHFGTWKPKLRRVGPTPAPKQGSSQPTRTPLASPTAGPRTPLASPTAGPRSENPKGPQSDSCRWEETAGKAQLYVDPSIIKRVRHRRNWPAFRDAVAREATRPMAETFALAAARGGRFRFVTSEHGPHYLEWRTQVWTNDSKASLFSGLAIPFAEGPPRCNLELPGPVAFYRGLSPQRFQYGHLLLDLLPLLQFLAAAEATSTLVLQRDPEGIIERFMRWYDRDLTKRLVFVNETQVVCTLGRLSLIKAKPGILRPDSMRLMSLWGPLRTQIRRLKESQPAVRAVAYQRVTGSVTHGRVMGRQSNRKLLAMAKAALKASGHPPQVVVFTGQKAGGRLMTFEEQYRLFNAAFLAYGPQGTGLANILWMQNADCHRRPAVIEFICSQDLQSSPGCFIWQNSQKVLSIKSTWHVAAGAFWVRYFHVWLLRGAMGQVEIDFIGFNQSLHEALKPLRL
ncbi:unnamed protein product [Symbiodinium natans]|uniref:Glycosyltransferase 61 catalytic domain-containing protein n=1 Tax=Symbiodinium natans TaxID=878477 RepID=A0A812V9T7_9DINO|nr:unnamed protein product [Symbiodinium natans]